MISTCIPPSTGPWPRWDSPAPPPSSRWCWSQPWTAAIFWHPHQPAPARRLHSCCRHSSTCWTSRAASRVPAACWCWPRPANWPCRWPPTPRRWRPTPASASKPSSVASAMKSSCRPWPRPPTSSWPLQAACSSTSRKRSSRATTLRYWCWTKRIACWTWALSRMWTASWKRRAIASTPCCSPPPWKGLALRSSPARSSRIR